ncbi:hypothetical protein [Pseudescherichia sp.]|uniref:hypothetical protein n=1 Tax=Pseudescherichia sp. TaxID=2055881 RepID=UPI00289DE796|nr:hypothetical protein [Pseudescherichia sp.]
MLMVYDAYIEPSGTGIDMLFHAHQCYNTVMNNPNITSEARKKIKVSDFDFLDILGENMTTKERSELRDKKKKEKQANDLDYMKNEIKKLALRNKNGK